MGVVLSCGATSVAFFCCYTKIKPLYVILSEENRNAVFVVEVLRVERSERAKPRSERDDGIWLGVSVACYGKCNIDSKATEILSHIPLQLRFALLLVRLRSTRRSSTSGFALRSE